MTVNGMLQLMDINRLLPPRCTPCCLHQPARPDDDRQPAHWFTYSATFRGTGRYRGLAQTAYWTEFRIDRLLLHPARHSGSACPFPVCATSPGYYQKLICSEQEFTELVETVTVPETWFFRTHQSFTALEGIAKHEWLPTHPNDVLHILSVPCSTGEEPYSIAMTLLDCGFQPAQFIIDAVDINNRNHYTAKQALYTRNSFRNQDLSFRDRHFKKSGSAYQLADRVKHTVNFIQGNLLDG